MSRQVVIKSSGVFHPENVVGNDFFVEHFTKLDPVMGEKVSRLLPNIGRNTRFLSNDPNENVLTMAHAAVLAALESGKVDISEIDGIVFSTETPEYLIPSTACMLQDTLKAVNAHMVYDLNANCAGMVVAVDQARAIMQTNKRLKKLVVVGAAMLQRCGEERNPITYASLGDAACAIILESVETNDTVGFIDSVYETDTQLIQSILYPKCGCTKSNNPDISSSEKLFIWEPFDTADAEMRCANLIKQIVNENGYSVEDVAKVCFTQFSDASRRKVADLANIPVEKFKYVGDVYGYTGTTSPFLAYHHAATDKELAKGDLVVFCGIGAGLTAAALLLKV